MVSRCLLTRLRVHLRLHVVPLRKVVYSCGVALGSWRAIHSHWAGVGALRSASDCDQVLLLTHNLLSTLVLHFKGVLLREASQLSHGIVIRVGLLSAWLTSSAMVLTLGSLPWSDDRRVCGSL